MALALVMVMRGDADLAERALHSARDHVDEIVVLDLGGDELARARLGQAGARVVPAAWSDDASACRNAALEAADADWNLVLDPEEWIDSGVESLADLARTRPDRVGLVQIWRGPGTPGEASHPVHLAPRLLPRGVRYEGAYREEPVHDLPTMRLVLTVASDDTETGRWRGDRTRNEAILLQALTIAPHDAMTHARFADELRITGRFTEAGDRYLQALGLMATVDDRRHELVTRGLEVLTKAGRYKDAIALMDDQRRYWQHSPDFTFLMGDLFFELMLETPESAPELAPLVETAFRRCLELGERPDLTGAVHGRGSFLAAQNLYVLHLTLGRAEDADRWWRLAGDLRLASGATHRLLG
ncbi:MAG: hypothetical protein Q4G43_09245 [Mobilicoccus sp.]|nr:hypothetical protein [Mobilicoccus sp.]